MTSDFSKELAASTERRKLEAKWHRNQEKKNQPLTATVKEKEKQSKALGSKDSYKKMREHNTLDNFGDKDE